MGDALASTGILSVNETLTRLTKHTYVNESCGLLISLALVRTLSRDDLVT